METRLQQFTAAQLRTIVIHEMRKFALALEYGSTISDLQEIREQVRLLADTLAAKEKEEAAPYFVESPLRSGLTA
ncbi:hypothetical protein [Longitalea luteola]|uniref:hypothetical protein n=1 Tax=Longitalea luteola TaxID=2812563 RepID=UPI001A966DA9|nr:hypothetical protein [Longitalea luteola]